MENEVMFMIGKSWKCHLSVGALPQPKQVVISLCINRSLNMDRWSKSSLVNGGQWGGQP